MKKTSYKLIILPHTLTIAFAMFLLIFGFDAFGGSEPIWEQILTRINDISNIYLNIKHIINT